MYQRMLKRFIECVRQRNYVVTLHADEEIDGEGLSILDVEKAILEGRIIERQKDMKTAEWKYLITGPARNEEIVTAVVKLGATGKMVLITVFGDEKQ